MESEQNEGVFFSPFHSLKKTVTKAKREGCWTWSVQTKAALASRPPPLSPSVRTWRGCQQPLSFISQEGCCQESHPSYNYTFFPFRVSRPPPWPTFIFETLTLWFFSNVYLYSYINTYYSQGPVRLWLQGSGFLHSEQRKHKSCLCPSSL